jgi:uncharacterized membrane protein YcaP (DUF421 family)
LNFLPASPLRAVWSAIDELLGLSATQAHELTWIQVCLRALVVYFVLIAYMRFGKKRFLSQATVFDVVLVFVVGSISSRAISGTAPFFASLAGTLTLILIHWVISFFTRSSKSLSYLFKGTDTILVREGKIDREALASEHMSDDDLAQDLREEGVLTVPDVKSARLERSGKLSVIKK